MLKVLRQGNHGLSVSMKHNQIEMFYNSGPCQTYHVWQILQFAAPFPLFLISQVEFFDTKETSRLMNGQHCHLYKKFLPSFCPMRSSNSKYLTEDKCRTNFFIFRFNSDPGQNTYIIHF